MAIYRSKLQNNFTMVSNRAANDARLSFAARGLYLYLLSKPDDWIIRRKDMMREGGIGKDALKTILDDLEGAGYIEKIAARNAGRYASCQYVLKADGEAYSEIQDNAGQNEENNEEQQNSAISTEADFPEPDKPHPVNPPHTKNLSLLSTDVHKNLRSYDADASFEKNSDLQDDNALSEKQPTPVTPDQKLFRRGTELLGDKARGMIGRLKKHFDNDCQKALDCIELAATKYAPMEYIGAIINKPKEPRAPHEKTADEFLDENRKYMGEEAYWAAKNIGKKP